MGNRRYQRTAQRITSAVNCRPLNCSPRSPIPVPAWPSTAPILPAGQRRPNLATEPSNVSSPMSIDPKDLWKALPPALRRQIVDDVAAILAEISREIRTGQTEPSGAKGCRSHPPIDTPPGGEQPREPAAAIRAS